MYCGSFIAAIVRETASPSAIIQNKAKNPPLLYTSNINEIHAKTKSQVNNKTGGCFNGYFPLLHEDFVLNQQIICAVEEASFGTFDALEICLMPMKSCIARA